MTRHASAATARSIFPAPRTARHLGARALFRPTPGMLAGFALVSFAFINVVGFFGVLFFFAATAAGIALRPTFNARELVRFSPLLLLPLLATLSTVWSDAPNATMRAGLQLLLTFAMVIAICRNLRPDRFVLLLFLALLFINLLLVPAIPSSLASGMPLVGWLGSKNQAAFMAYLLVALSLAMAFDRNQPAAARLAVVVALPLALVITMLARSGGGTSSVALCFLVLPPLALLTSFRPSVRVALALFALCAAGLAGLFMDDIAAMVASFRQDVLGKDATLTGRTYLWEFAERLSASRPWFGYGYGAFWRQGNIDAEGLWRWGGIASRSGFNFHNEFVETRVGLGLVGLGLLAATCVGVALAGLVRQIARPSVPMAFLLCITTVSYARSFVEDGLVAQFSLVTLLWLATALYAFPGGAERDGPRAPARPRGFTAAGPRLRPEPRGPDAPTGR